jgi:hypothetical protein
MSFSFTDEPIIRFRQFAGIKGSACDLRSDARGIAQRDGNAWAHYPQWTSIRRRFRKS